MHYINTAGMGTTEAQEALALADELVDLNDEALLHLDESGSLYTLDELALDEDKDEEEAALAADFYEGGSAFTLDAFVEDLLS